ncbi:MAG TPA: hypothetical protein VIU62_22305 [Chloroflexota bacterium]|jgi:hypothetical protein
MDLRQVRQQCEARLQTLALPTPFDVDVFCANLAAQRGRPIVLLPMRRVGEVTGMWIGLSTVDIIAYSRATSRLHQEHIIVHEISHVLCGHQPALSDVDVAACSFLDGEIDLLDVEIGARQHVLYRGPYTSEEEQEVEVLASLIMERMQRHRATTPLPERLEAVLEEGARRSA